MAELPPRPERPQLAHRGDKPRRSNWLTVLVAFGMAIAGLMSLMLMPLLNFAPVIVLAVFGFAALHYLVWGRWLSRYIREEDQEEDE